MSNSNEILKRRQMVSTARKSPFWAIVNLASFLICLFEFKYAILSNFLYLNMIGNVIASLEFCLVLLFLVNFIYNAWLFVWLKKFMHSIELTPNEFMLFGISHQEIGFKLKIVDVKDTKVNTPVKTTENYPSTPPFDISTSSIMEKHSSLDSTAISTRLFDSSLDSTSASWSYKGPASDLRSRKINTSHMFNNSGNELKYRKSNSFLANLSHSGQKPVTISSQDDLKRYLTEQEERTEHINELVQAQKRLASVTGSSTHMNSPVNVVQKADNPFNSSYSSRNQSFGSSFNNSNISPYSSPSQVAQMNTSTSEARLSNAQDLTQALPLYQPAIKVSTVPSNPEKAESVNYSHSSTKSLEKVLAKLDIDDSRLNQMVENIRKWISQTILIRLAEEIDSINKIISEKGFIDSLIGEISIQQLKQLAINKKNDFPTLEQLCDFLDINARNIENNATLQQYLVRRIKDLAKGGCITEFLWEGGGSYNYKPWKEDMFTDSEIILHLFCVYMDSRLLFNPTIPEGKPFTSQHFMLRLGSIPKSDTYIQQMKTFPPHYSLILKKENFDLPPGRNNLFYALLVFLHHIKVKNFGLLGRINLGASGLNIAWVIDN